MKQDFFSVKAASVSVLVPVFAGCVLQTGTQTSARTLILQGLPMAAMLAVILALLAAAEQYSNVFSGNGIGPCVIRAGLILWFAWELFEIVRQAQELCWTHFSSMAVLGLLPLLLWAGWALEPAVFARSAPMLCWAAAGAALLCLLGLNGQLRWQNLMQPVPEVRPDFPLYAEYFALPLLCPNQELRQGVRLPFKVFFLMAGYTLCMELLFGPESLESGIELLRAGSIGSVSRFDAAVLLVWLAAALFRICFLVQVIRQLCASFRTKTLPMEDAA